MIDPLSMGGTLPFGRVP